MTNKYISNLIADIISVSNRPVVVGGAIYKERSGQVNLDGEAVDALLEAMARLHCRSVGFGTYDCYENTKFGIACDRCLTGEINRLNSSGIKTTGCCCGHGQLQGFIQVLPEYCVDMKRLGYEELPIEKNGNGEFAFKPKTALPKAEKQTNRPPSMHWRATDNEVYYHVTSAGEIYGTKDEGTPYDNQRYQLGNYFKTEEEAKQSAIYKAFHGEEQE